MKHLHLILLLIPAFLFSQKKTIVPQQGTIVFSSKAIITDYNLYMSSLEEFMASYNKAMELESLTNGKQNDSLMLEDSFTIIEKNFGDYIEALEDIDTKTQYHHEFKGNLIVVYKTSNNQKLGDSTIIDTKTGLVTKNHENQIYYSNNEIFDIKEFRKETKKINGFECFKVSYSFKQESDGDLSSFMDISTVHREIWVTEKIRCNFHPVINDRAILEKYYPLEILQRSETIKGCEISYGVVEMQIN